MRRDRLLKICANHRIDAYINLEVVDEKRLKWFVNDFSEAKLHPVIFLARLRSSEDVFKFQNEFKKADHR